MPFWTEKSLSAWGESNGWLKPMLIDVETVCAENTDRVLHRLLQIAGGGRANLEAGGVDEADQQRFAAIA